MDAIPLPAVTRSSQRPLLWVVAIAFFMQSLDMTILNTALPSMAREFAVSAVAMRAVVIAYVLTVAMLIPASGWVADRMGLRRTFVLAIALFTLGSWCCAMSPSLPLLVLARVLQGVGGAMMVPIGRLAILRTVPRSELVQSLSFVTMPGMAGPLVGPSLGGWLVQHASWPWIFLVNLPIGLIGCLAAWRFVPRLRQTATPFDWRGYACFGSAMLLISMGLQQLGEHNADQHPWLLILAGLGALLAYWWHARGAENPLFTLKLLDIRSFKVGITGNLFARLTAGGMPFLTPLLLQLGLGLPPAQAGMAMLPGALAAFSIKPWVKTVVDRFGYRQLLVGNTVLLGVLVSSFALINQTTPLTQVLVMLFMYGAVNSLQITTMNSLTLRDLTDRLASSGNSLLSVIMQLSQGFGVAIAGAILGLFIGGHGPAMHTLTAFHYTYICAGMMAVPASLIFLRLPTKACDAKRQLRLQAEIGHVEN